MTLPTEKQKNTLLHLNCFAKSETGYSSLNASQGTAFSLKF